MVQSILEIIHSLDESIKSLLADTTTVTCRLRDLEIIECIVKKPPFLLKGCDASLQITEVLTLEGLVFRAKAISLILELLYRTVDLLLQKTLERTSLSVCVENQFALKLIQINNVLLLVRSEIASH